MKMARSVIVYGPQGCGKNRNATRIAAAYGLCRVVDLERADDFQEEDGTLYLCNSIALVYEFFSKVQCVHYEYAIRWYCEGSDRG